jgi:hypothetical protein
MPANQFGGACSFYSDRVIDVPELVALLDSCVLYPAPLRDLLVRLAGAGLLRARWTNEIHDEWISSVLANRPDLTRERLERTRDLTNEHILDSVVTGYSRTFTVTPVSFFRASYASSGVPPGM